MIVWSDFEEVSYQIRIGKAYESNRIGKTSLKSVLRIKTISESNENQRLS